ncbi:hypothetical protein [Alteromonas ponticola]|uniref:Uncharacterized protein n=1 Tax=Alteromonas ponticola TaxID=2720613 RepID=A0ABX1R5T1_9ALTE|nr:hypothetical protein [Alteromonas ponticola]NMH61006.1 hypothetical protein [Alteromonas ponticola]
MVENIINRIAIDKFRARQAYSLDSNMWNIDGSLNDVRAVCNDGNEIVKFFCRYEEDIKRTDAKIAEFARNHSTLCELVNSKE